MPNPTLEDDIALLRMAVDSTLLKYGDDRVTLLAALNRLAKAVGERGHLDEACRGYCAHLTTLDVRGVALTDHAIAWLDRERARKRGERVLKSEP